MISTNYEPSIKKYYIKNKKNLLNIQKDPQVQQLGFQKISAMVLCHKSCFC